MAGVDTQALRWLLTAPGQDLLARAVSAYAEHAGDPVATAAALRRAVAGAVDGAVEGAVEGAVHGAAAPLPPAGAQAVALTVARLRERGLAKLGEDARRMYLTQDGLEQCTRRRVAEHRATRLRDAGVGAVLDVGCGIGGDLLALARAGLRVEGVDHDELRVELARANLAALGLDGSVRCADAAEVDLDAATAAGGAVFLDPARRTARGRVLDESGWSPPWSFVLEVLSRPACVKAAPGIAHRLPPAGTEAEWVSDDGGVKEAALWSPPLATAVRRATVLTAAGAATLTDRDPSCTQVRPVGRFLHEPDGAVIRAGLVGAVAAAVGGGLLDQHIAYVTSDEAVRTPYARTYEVLEELPTREKALRAALRARDVGRLTVKKRGVEVVPEVLRRRLAAGGALSGSGEATLVVTRVAGRGTTLLVRPVD